MRIYRFSSEIGEIKVTVHGPEPTTDEILKLYAHFEPLLQKGGLLCDECGSYDLRVKGSALLEPENTLIDAKFTCQECSHMMHHVLASDPNKDCNPSRSEG